MFVQQFNSKTLPNELKNLLMHTSNIHSHYTRISSNSGLFIPQISSTLVVTLLNIWLLMYGIISPGCTQGYVIFIVLSVLKIS